MKLFVIALGILLNSSVVFAQDIDITTCMSDSTKAHFSIIGERTYLDFIDASGKITNSYVKKLDRTEKTDSETIDLVQTFLNKEIGLKSKVTGGIYIYTKGFVFPSSDTMLLVVDSDNKTYLLHDGDDNEFDFFGSPDFCTK